MEASEEKLPHQELWPGSSAAVPGALARKLCSSFQKEEVVSQYPVLLLLPSVPYLYGHLLSTELTRQPGAAQTGQRMTGVGTVETRRDKGEPTHQLPGGSPCL